MAPPQSNIKRHLAITQGEIRRTSCAVFETTGDHAGHIHLRDFAGVPGVAVAQAKAPDPAGDHNNGNSTDDYCLICAAAKLAGTAVLPIQFGLVLPIFSTDEPHVYVCSASHGRGDHALFRARAPPFA